MKALYFDGDKLIIRDDYPRPEPDPRECLIETSLAGICDTDVQLTRGYMGFSGVPGHEFVGVVREGADELIGKRVVGEINCPCGECAFCRRGLGNHCPDRTVLGIVNRSGCFAEYVALPAENLHVVPDTVSDEAAVFAEPLAAAANVPELVHIGEADRVLVLGDGKLGLLIAAVLVAGGYDASVAGRHPERSDILAEIGHSVSVLPVADIDGGYDVVVEVTGTLEGLALALQSVVPLGTVVLKTTVAGNYDIDLSSIVINEIKVVGNRCGPFDAALRLLENHIVDPRPLIEGTIDLAGTKDLLEQEVMGLKWLVEIE
ncbi:MAG: alcohol dehydrogenase catalytic domain-containing protein [bacterium]|nr:alcohol dehydrogenase catalytic domain-containing protein [bacterium]